MTTIEKILQSNGPLMSSKLVSLVEKQEKIGNNTASQKVSRDNSILKFKGFYSSGQAFCYLDKHIIEPDFFDKLLKSMEESGRKYWYCLNAIKMTGGIISQKFLECYTNYPVLALKSHIPFKEILQKFVSTNILIFNDNNYLISPRFNQSYLNFTQYSTIEMIKEDILNNFHSFTKNTGFISYNTGKTFAEFGKLKWAFKGLCPVSGIKTNGKFGFLLADILFGHSIYEKDVQFFIEKLKTVQNFKNASRLLPFLLVDDLEPRALEALKKNGIIVCFIKELFGQKYADTLKDLVGILNNAGASLKQDPNKYLDLIDELKKYNNGLANNIKGTLFEFVIGHFHSVRSNSSIDLGREIFDNGKKHEVDVLAVYNDRIVFAECKATKSQIEKSQIEKWTSEKIPAFRNWANKQETWKNKKLEFEYWSTSGFETDAEAILSKLSSTANTIKVSYYNGQDIRNKTIEMKNKKLKEAVDNYFLKTSV
jgi:hypothetical protein